MQHRKQDWFQLRPDFVISKKRKPVAILDAKWKLLDSGSNDMVRKYNLNQNDFYQLYAYGQKYLEGKGLLILIFPAYGKFAQCLPVFKFSDYLALWAVPFDLENEILKLPVEAGISWMKS